ncbi:MAG: DUF1801 domain-containing protein [Bacteroidetes bacterium]|nr:DUF1801 domain-containing protein [Bacteroidota bacterium]
MKAAENYIYDAPEKYRDLLYRLREILLNASPYIEEKIAYMVPFYKHFGMLCYIAHGKRGVEVGFWRGHELSNEQGVLISDGRKIVRSLVYEKMEELDESILMEIVQEAMLLNEEHFKNKKKKK